MKDFKFGCFLWGVFIQYKFGMLRINHPKVRMILVVDFDLENPIDLYIRRTGCPSYARKKN